MLEKGKISPRQTGEIIFNTMLVTSVLIIPATTVKAAGQAAWISIFLGAGLGIITLALVMWLGNKHPGKNLFQIAEAVLGKWLGKYIGLVYVALFMRIVAISAREYGDFLTTAFMPNTPLSVFIVSLLFLTAWAALGGLEIIARMNEFIIILVVSSLLFIIALSTPNWELANLLPLLPPQGIIPVLTTSTFAEVWKAETIAILVILPFITRPNRAFLAGAAATIGASTLLALGIIGAIAIFTPQLVPTFRFPIHLFARTINIADILTRFEVIIMVTWIAGVLIKATFFHYCASLGLAHIFGLSEYRALVVPVGVIIAVNSFAAFKSIAEVEMAFSAPSITFVIQFIILPLLLLLVTIIREKIFKKDFTGDTKDA